MSGDPVAGDGSFPPPNTRSGKRIEVLGQLIIERSDSSSSGTGKDERPIQINLHTMPDDRIVVDVSHLPPWRQWNSVSKHLWRSRQTISKLFAVVDQPLQIKIGGETWADIDVSPSRIGRMLKMPHLSFRFATTKILPKWFRK